MTAQVFTPTTDVGAFFPKENKQYRSGKYRLYFRLNNNRAYNPSGVITNVNTPTPIVF